MVQRYLEDFLDQPLGMDGRHYRYPRNPIDGKPGSIQQQQN